MSHRRADTYQYVPPGRTVWLLGVNHQVCFSALQKMVPTPPVPILNFVRSVQVLERLLCDVDPPIDEQ